MDRTLHENSRKEVRHFLEFTLFPAVKRVEEIIAQRDKYIKSSTKWQEEYLILKNQHEELAHAYKTLQEETPC